MPPVRMAIEIATAIILLVLCELKAARKCFIFDLRKLSELYRVASFLGLALCLALVALALQRFVLSARKE